MTKLEFFNRVLFQFLFIRLTNIRSRVQTAEGYEIREWYAFQYWVVPLTGWSTPFEYLNETPKYLKVTEVVVHEHNIIK